jgi:diguanylate cyclase (GGDEF)-like protein
MRPGDRAAATPTVATHELASLEERLGLLLVVRIGMVALVLLAGLLAPDQVGFTFLEVGPVCAAYLAVAAGAEWYRRRGSAGRMLVHRLALPLDAVFLAIVTTPAGGPSSQLVVLFAVQLISVTLLASQRAGIRIALWDSFLFILIPTLSLSGRIGDLMMLRTVAAPPVTDTALAIMGFWVVAICTAVFSTVSERELRRNKGELEALAEMAARLEDTSDEEEILTVFLHAVMVAFPFRRGALWWTRGERLETLSLVAPGGEVVTVPVEGRRPTDQVAAEALAQRTAILVRALDEERDPVGSGLIGGARNVVVLPLEIERGDSGIALLEHGGHPALARLPRRTLVMLNQFATHAALSLRNARLLAAQERAAAIDGLTGLANRREFDRALAREVSRADRLHEPLTLAVVDVDHFKQVNDTRGHLAGDEVLRVLATVLAEGVRDMDLVARYGGEEFALVLPRCDQRNAIVVVDRIRAAIAAHPDLRGVTVSAGIASLPGNASDGTSLVDAADAALYESKRGGRDRSSVSKRHDVRHLGSLGA